MNQKNPPWNENILSSVKALLLTRLHLISKSVSRADLLWENPVWPSLCWYLLLGGNTQKVKQTHSQAAIIAGNCLKNILCWISFPCLFLRQQSTPVFEWRLSNVPLYDPQQPVHSVCLSLHNQKQTCCMQFAPIVSLEEWRGTDGCQNENNQQMQPQQRHVFSAKPFTLSPVHL